MVLRILSTLIADDTATAVRRGCSYMDSPLVAVIGGAGHYTGKASHVAYLAGRGCTFMPSHSSPILLLVSGLYRGSLVSCMFVVSGRGSAALVDAVWRVYIPRRMTYSEYVDLERGSITLVDGILGSRLRSPKPRGWGVDGG